MKVIIGFCQTQPKEAPKLAPNRTKEELCDWISAASDFIVNDVVPPSFWTISNNPKPGPITDLCPSLYGSSSMIVQLVLWSWCSKTCTDQITNCLRAGMKQWHTDYPLQWIHAYIVSARAYMKCSRMHTRLDEQWKTEGNVILDAYCLIEALTNSTALFRILTTQNTKELLSDYTEFLHTQTFRTPKKSLSEVPVLYDPGEDVTIISVQWFRDTYMLPLLKRIFALDKMEHYIKQLRKMAEYDKKTLKETDDLGIEVQKALNINGERGHQLFMFAMCADIFMGQKKTNLFLSERR